MNKNLYRIIYNEQRAQLMVVAETARSDGKSAADRRSEKRPAVPYWATLRVLSFSLLAALGLVVCLPPAAHAQIVAYRSAPGSQQPTILNAGTGIPLVNIQTPSGAGVSRNSYSQFDVQPAGAILNNSRSATQSQLGGWVPANPWLATGSARVILNQVLSANPSLLRGYVEVAGSQAQVVIANPAGVTCAGCGFINANRVTLTTGTPIINGGNLDGYRVEGGTLRVEGAGLDASRVTHTDLIARAVEINAGLWANTLRITAGTNQVDAEHTVATPIVGHGAAPVFALDVAQIGGMYAGKITLVGTDAGVGVRNAGAIGASVGEVQLSFDGRLHNSGRITSAGDMQIDSGGGIDNSGTVYAHTDALINTRGNIENTGTIAAQGHTTLFATGAGSHVSGTPDSLLVAGLNPDGNLAGSARLTVGAREQIAMHGQAIASGDQSLRAGALDLSDSQIRADNLTLTATSGHLDVRRSALSANGTLSASAAQSLLHDSARSDAKQLQLAAHNISNVRGELLQTGNADISIALAGSFNNAQGRLASNSGNLGLAAQAIDNSDGSIIHAGSGTLNLSAATLTGSHGNLGSSGRLDLVAQNVTLDGASTVAEQLRISAATLTNRGGQIVLTGRGETVIKATGSIDNRGGTLTAASSAQLTVTAGGTLDNSTGVIGTQGDMRMAAQSVRNTQGQISAGQALQIVASQTIDNNQGLLAANGLLILKSNGIDNSQGTTASVLDQVVADAGSGAFNNSRGRIEAAQALTLAGTAMNNSDGVIVGQKLELDSRHQAFDSHRGKLAASGSLLLRSGMLANDAGLIQAGGELTIDTHGQRLSNTDSGSTAGILGQSTVSLVTGDLDNSAGFIGAKGTLTATSSGAIDNRGGLISSAETVQILDPNASPTSNAASKTLSIIDTGGTLIADQRLVVDSAGLSGDGAVVSRGDLTVKLLADFIHTGQFSANGNAALETAGDLTSRAALQAGKRLDVKAANIFNEASGEIVATTLQLTTPVGLTNRGLIDGSDTFIDSATVNNLGTGRIYGDHLAIAAMALHNDAENGSAPVIAARKRLDIGAAAISNREHALLFSASELAIGGALDAGHHATAQAGTLDNASATVEALGNLAIDAGQINNTNEHFSTEIVAAASELVDHYVLSGSATRYRPSEVTLLWDKAPGTYFHPPQGSGMDFMSQQGFFSDNSNNYIYLNTPEGSGRNFWLYSVTRNTMESQVLTTDPGKIIAGGNLQLTADRVFNHDSQIVAGGSLAGTIGQLSNLASAGERTVSDSGTAWYVFRDRDHHDSDRDPYAYNPAPVVTGFLLPSLRYDSNANASGSSTSVAPRTVVSVNQATAATTPRDDIKGTATVIRTISPNIVVPNNSLFRINSNPTAHYLVETDSKFSSNRLWLSSGYLLNALTTAQKRPGDTVKQILLGDGFYEQRLINEQIAQLTGQRFLDGYASDEAQYQALMDAGLTYAKSWQLIPGVALSAEQMAQLTSDIVWLVEKDIVLPNGQTRRALVPQVYVRVGDDDLSPGGALIAASDIDLRLGGDLINSGSIAGRQLVVLSAENVANLGGRISGQDALISARNDLLNLGGTLQAQDRLIARAGRDLTVGSTTRTQTNDQGHRTHLDRVAGLYVTGSNGTLVAAAGNDLTLLAAVISNAAPTAAGTPDTANGSTMLAAGNNLDIGTVSESRSDASVRDARNYRRTTQSSEVGSEIRSSGDLTLLAGNDLSARAASVTSDHGALSALAGNDLVITTGQARNTADEAHRYSQKGFFSSTTTTTRDTLDATTTLASTLSGDTVTLQSGRDILIKGSSVVASGDATLLAGNNLAIEAANETRSESHFQKTTQSGIFGSGGIGFTIGSRELSSDQQIQATTAAASTIGSIDGDVLMNAGKAYRQVGSDVIAARGSIGITAESVDILEARETSRITYETKAKQSGLTLALTSPVISAVQTAQQMYDAASDTKDSRMKLLAAANTALAAKMAYDDVQIGQGATIDGKENQMPITDDSGKLIGNRDATVGERAGGINLSISIGGSSSSSKTTQTSDSAAISTLAAGQDITIVASGAAKNSDLTIQGAKLTAGNDIALKADDEIRLLAAKNSAEQHSSNKNSSASVGFSIGTSGLLFNVGASGGRGNADGADTWWTNTHLDAGHRVSLESGGNTTMSGALARGEQVIAKVGTGGQGNLLIESLQDLSRYDSKQQSAGFSVSIGMGRISGSLSYSQSKISSDYASVAEQSGIKAGDGGFQVEVSGDTTLNGAVIASTQNAVDKHSNVFTTGGTLTTRDIENRADYSAKSASVNLGSNMSFDGKLMPGGTGVGYGKDSGSAASTTPAGISGIAGNQSVRTGDAETGIAKIFDADKVQKEIEAQTKITQQFGQLASKAVDDYVQGQRNILREQLKTATSETDKTAVQGRLDELIRQERVMNVLIGAVSGMGGSALTKESLSAGADQMRQYMIENSRKFLGAVDSEGKVLSNLLVGKSEGVRGDGIGLAGSRGDLDLLCGSDNSRCAIQRTPDGTPVLVDGKTVLATTTQGFVQFTAKDENDNPITFSDFMKTDDGKKMAAPTGGVQGFKGTLFGVSYQAGSWQDKLLEAFSGTHDFIGGTLSGLYDAQGNIKRGMTEAEINAYAAWSVVALVPSAPFAAAELLPPEIWSAISILLKAGR